jgi:hypothetical protein
MLRDSVYLRLFGSLFPRACMVVDSFLIDVDHEAFAILFGLLFLIIIKSHMALSKRCLIERQP